jgi:hypothetical protein
MAGALVSRWNNWLAGQRVEQSVGQLVERCVERWVGKLVGQLGNK